METWRDISVIIAMLVANGLAIMTYYRWTRRQGSRRSSKEEVKTLDSIEEEIQVANNQPRESIIYGITREEYEKRIIQLEDFIAKEDSKSKSESSSSRKSSLGSPISSDIEVDQTADGISINDEISFEDEPEIIEDEVEEIKISSDENVSSNIWKIWHFRGDLSLKFLMFYP